MLVDDVLSRRRLCVPSFEELSALEQGISEIRDYAPRSTIVRQGEPCHHSTLLLEGLVSRHVDGRDGNRQLVAIQVPGDFVDLHAFPLKVLDHDVGSMTACRVALVPHAHLDRILHQMPGFARKLWFLTLIDAAIHRAWLLRIGRLRAVARVAHFLCEINLRLQVVGRSNGHDFPLPLTQADLGTICGLTAIHVNRVLRELRNLELCTFRAFRVEIHDLTRLMQLGAFEPDYLYLQPDAVAGNSAAKREEMRDGQQRR